ncbi:MAG TPA: RDD family protein, partial [Candidatus Sulfotelmatobacter sp.]|nr:RDD family protein [Candidatus Sulfotelmatobacter sp.]
MPSDKLIIDTPEQVHLEFVLAGIGSRFMAVFLDVLIEAVLYLILFLLTLIWQSGGLFGPARSLWWNAIVTLVIFCINWGYYAFFEVLWKGQTPGKRWAGIRVIKDSGRPINAFEAISRNLIRFIDFLPGFYGIGVVTMLLNSKNRRLGDYVAGTLVVHETSDRESTLFFNTSARTEFTLHQAAGLTVQEAELIETFLARRLEIPPEVRKFNAQRITD